MCEGVVARTQMVRDAGNALFRQFFPDDKRVQFQEWILGKAAAELYRL